MTILLFRAALLCWPVP